MSQNKTLRANPETPHPLALDVREHNDGVTFPVMVQPRSKKNEVVGLTNGALKIKVTAPPVEGAANEALLKLLSQTFELKKSDLKIVRMKTSPRKLIFCRGLTLKKIAPLLKSISAPS